MRLIVKITGYRYSEVPIDKRPYHETTIDLDREFVPDSAPRPVLLITGNTDKWSDPYG